MYVYLQWSVGSSSTPSTSSSLRGLTEVTKGAPVRPVYRPSTQAGFGRSTASVRVGQPQTGAVNRSTGGGGGPGASYGRSRPQSVYRRASISSFGGADWDEDLGPRPLPPVKTLQRSSYVGGGSAGRGSVKPSERQYLSASRFNVRANDFTSGDGSHPAKTSDNDVHHRKKQDYEV